MNSYNDELKTKKKDNEVENIQKHIENVISLLRNYIEFDNGFKIRSKGELNINLKLDGNKLMITFLDPKPTLEKKVLITLSRTINGFNCTTDEIEVDLSGFPNQILKVIS